MATSAAAGTGAWLLSSDALAEVVAAVRRTGTPGAQALPFEDALLGVCAAVLLLCLAWLLLTGAVAVATHLAQQAAPRARAVRALTVVHDCAVPGTVRRAVAAALGVAVTTGLASVPVSAVPRGGPDALTGLAVPDRTTGTAGMRRGPAPVPDRVVVRPGQSLWLIAEDLLSDRAGPGSRRRATDREVTGAWHLLHRANVAVVGRDPDLILPGTSLVVPELTAPHREDPR